jgi:hypothetical protein
MGYTIERELMVPDEFHHRQITPELLSDYGYAANTEQYLLNMATLLIRATNAGPYWRIDATALGVDVLDSIQVGEIRCDRATPRESLLNITHEWMRDSPTSLYVPRPPVELPINKSSWDQFLCAFALIRTKDCLIDIADRGRLDSSQIRE